MSYIESVKTYTGTSLDEIFFRPIVKDSLFSDLGIRVLYNAPIPTTLSLWSIDRDPLNPFTSSGWAANETSTKEQKELEMTKIKAEMAFSAHDYFSLVYENITSRSNVNFQDLSGTELEDAETELFRRALQESIRATMWFGDGNNMMQYNTFKGFITQAFDRIWAEKINYFSFKASSVSDSDFAPSTLEKLWEAASEDLKAAKGEGHLTFFVTAEIYYGYERYLETLGGDIGAAAYIDGRRELFFRGIPVVNMQIAKYNRYQIQSGEFAMLVDKRNMVLAVNTNDLPGSEIRMWYNPDEMENRQRAVFMIGCDFVNDNLLAVAYQDILS